MHKLNLITQLFSILRWGVEVWLASAHSKEKVQLTGLNVCDQGSVIKICKLHSSMCSAIDLLSGELGHDNLRHGGGAGPR